MKALNLTCTVDYSRTDSIPVMVHGDPTCKRLADEQRAQGIEVYDASAEMVNTLIRPPHAATTPEYIVVMDCGTCR